MASAKIEDHNVVGYEDAYAGWALGQVAALREREVLALDREHLAEEIAGLAGSERDRLEAAIRIVVLHLLKCDYRPERRSRSWVNSIAEHRERAVKRLRDSPSLKSALRDIVADAYVGGRRGAAVQMDRPRKSLPADCPYSFDEIMTRPVEWDGETA